ncbi:MAG: FtsW/RodA/SpoVE family cell cycle protein, partial [Myxococcota bacterium]
MSILRSVLAAKKVDAKPSRKGQNVAAPVAESGRKPAAKKTGTKPTGASPNDVGQAGLRLRDRFRVVRLDAPKVTGPADAMLAAAIVALVAFGVVMVYSASAVFASQQYGNGQHFLIRQGIFAAVGLFVMVAVAKVDYHRYRKLTYLGLIFAIALLFAVILGFGRSAGGATRWISLGFINIQPAEIAKVIFIFWLAYSLSKKSDKIRSFSVGFLPHVMVAGLLMLLCLK